MNNLFKLMTAIMVLLFWISCNSGVSNPSSYVELMKNQKLSVFSSDATIGEVFNTVSKGKVVWETLSMPENDSEYRYRNIHNTSVLVQATWVYKYRPINTAGFYSNEKHMMTIPDDNLTIQFAVKKDKTEFELYRIALNGEYKDASDSILFAREGVGSEYNAILWDRGAQKRNEEEKIEKKQKEIEEKVLNEKRIVENEKERIEILAKIEFIKKTYSNIFNDTIENICNIISDKNPEMSGGNGRYEVKNEWRAQKIQNLNPENINKNLYIVTATIFVTWDVQYYSSWGSVPIEISFYAGEDWTKIEGKNIKQGDIYNIKMCNRHNIGTTSYPKDSNDDEKRDFITSKIIELYEQKTGKTIKYMEQTEETK